MRILLALGAAAAAGVTGTIVQVPGGAAVRSLTAVAVSADGRNAYAVGGVGSLGLVAGFERRSDGSLSRFRVQGRVGLETPKAVAIAPNGKLVVTAAENGRALGVWRRGKRGFLTPLARVPGFAHPSGLAFSPNGMLLLVADDSGVVSLRSSDAGFTRVGAAACDEFIRCNAVAFSPDGGYAYAVAGGGAHGSVTSFAVAPDGTVVALPPTVAHAVNQPFALAVSPDGRNVYVAGSVSDSVVTFVRDPATGLVAQAGCITMTGSKGACVKGRGIAGAWAIAVSRDGKSVYVASYASKAVAAFLRGAGGVLRERQVVDPRGVTRVTGVAVSPDGRNVYAAGTGGLAVFARR
jgi:DNA-binding beta-propeller fold protein YncE